MSKREKTAGKITVSGPGDRAVSEYDWHNFSPEYTPQEFYQKMTVGLPEATDLKIKFDGPNVRTIDYNYVGNNQNRFYFARHFENNTADHSMAHALPMGQGMSTIINAYMFSMYPSMGITKINLIADKVGPYAHGRLGFVPNDEDQWPRICEAIEKRLHFLQTYMKDMGQVEPSAAERIEKATQDSSAKAYWKIIDEPSKFGPYDLSKILTIRDFYLPDAFEKAVKKVRNQEPDINETIYRHGETEWCGYFDMTDPEFTVRANAYFQRKLPDMDIHPVIRPAPSNTSSARFCSPRCH